MLSLASGRSLEFLLEIVLFVEEESEQSLLILPSPAKNFFWGGGGGEGGEALLAGFALILGPIAVWYS